MEGTGTAPAGRARSGTAVLALAGVVLALALALAALPACSSGDGGPGRDPSLPASARLLVIFGLRRDDRGLAAAVRRSSGPSSASYGRFLSPAEVARRYGAAAADRRAVLDRLRRAGVRAHVDASGGAVLAAMDAEQVHDVFGAWPQAERRDDGEVVAAVQEALRVPGSLAGPVTEVVGARSTIRAARTTPVAGTPTAPSCTGTDAAVGRRSPLGAWYGYDQYLYGDASSGSSSGSSSSAAPGRGAGRRIGVLAIGRWSPAVLDAFVACYRTRPTGRVRVRPAPLAPRVPVGPEVSLDVVVATAFAPEAAVDVLQYDPNGSLAAGFLQAFAEGTRGPRYDAVSTSIGYCETDLEPGERTVTDHALLALAAVGTTVVASSGDSGSAACYPDSRRAAVQYPASSPWLTGVGGTSLRADGSGAIVDEVAWRAASATPLAGGGGSSRAYATPWYQRGLRTPGAATGRRTVPDVAFLADPTVVPPVPICPAPGRCTWYRLAGTSAPAPALAAALALVAGDLGASSGRPGRLGLLGPLVRRLAERHPDGVHDVTEGSNAVLGLRCCEAGPGYDLVTGWGSLVLPALADQAAAARHRR